ncbi:MAG: hypothetical protein JXA60_12010 [Candidatus Coatesbacteria bacterium]|nr:hypothetical protein [Candidatus Coatesbacteria bacterium]
MSELDILFKPVRRKHRMQFITSLLQKAFLLGMAFLLLWTIAFKLFSLNYPWYWGFSILLIAFLAAIVYGIAAPLDSIRTARLLDKQLKLKEKIQTGLEFKNKTSPLINALLDDCRDTLTNLDIRNTFPLKFEKFSWLIPILLLTSILGLLYLPPLSAKSTKATIKQEPDVVKELKELKEFYKTKRASEKNPIIAKKYENMEKRLEKLLANKELTRKEAMNEMKYQMEKMKEEFSDQARKEELKNKLTKMGQDLSKNKELGETAKGMQKQEWEKAKKELEKVKKTLSENKADKESIKDAAKSIENSANDLKSADPKLAEQMQKLSQQLKNNQQKEASKTLKDLENKLEQLSKEKKEGT